MVSVDLDMRSLAFFDVAAKSWVAEAGRFAVLAGVSSADIHERAYFTLEADWIDDAPARAAAKPYRP